MENKLIWEKWEICFTKKDGCDHLYFFDEENLLFLLKGWVKFFFNPSSILKTRLDCCHTQQSPNKIPVMVNRPSSISRSTSVAEKKPLDQHDNWSFCGRFGCNNLCRCVRESSCFSTHELIFFFLLYMINFFFFNSYFWFVFWCETCVWNGFILNIFCFILPILSLYFCFCYMD